MRARTVVTAATAAGIAAAVLTISAPASLAAGATRPHLVGSAAGSTVTAVGGVVTSGPTAASSVDTLSGGQTSSNTTADVAVAGVASSGTVSTSTTSSTVAGGGLSLTSHARTQGLNVLNGAITAKAVDTVATATITADGSVSDVIDTTFTDLRVLGLPVVLTTPHNTTVGIPGVATVTLNSVSEKKGTGAVSASGAGLVVTLLGGAAGSTVTLNPVAADITQVGPRYTPLDGYAYVTRIAASVDGLVTVYSGPTGSSAMPHVGTDGRDVTNNTAAVNLPGIATIGAIGSIANGALTDTVTRSTMSAHATSVNLLNGAITADAVGATATEKLNAAGQPVGTGSSTLVNLVIGGTRIPVNTKPNTSITIPGLAKVTVNAQSRTARSATVHALDVRLTTARLGLPAGAIIEVGVASASFLP